MNKKLNDIPVSVLDLATIREGDTATDAFHRSLALAQHVERLGYMRFWLAEHHNMESVASSATSVLIGYIAGGTKRIRVGSGGVMLPNHAPLIIAEEFGTLESLYPGRIDLGLGRAPGTDGVTSAALRRMLNNSVDDFPRDVLELLSYLAPRDPAARVRAIPGEGLQVPVWLLGSSLYSAQLAAMLGLPFAFASHFAPAYLYEALQVYRDTFKPCEHLQQPYTIACVNVIASDTDAEARLMATSFQMLALGLIRNKRRPLQPPVASMEGLWSEPERAAVQQFMQFSFIGSADTVQDSMQTFLDRTGVDEIMVTSHIYDHEARLRSYGIIAPFFKTSTTAHAQL